MARSSTAAAWARGGLVFAATMMIMLGIWQVIMGIAAIAKGEFFVVAPNYVYNVDTTAWGWIHLVLGALTAVAGFFLFTGATWARALGIALAALSAINSFFFIPYQPVWSVTVIALDVFVIWALCTVDTDRMARDTTDDMSGLADYSDDMPQSATSAGSAMAAEGMSSAQQKWPAANKPSTGRVWSEEPPKTTGMPPSAAGGTPSAPQPPSTSTRPQQ